jgi:hypothetical protein
LDRTLGSGKFAIAAEQLTFGRVVEAVEHASGQPYTRRSLGTVDDLRAQIDTARAAGASPADVVMQVYLLYMLTGQTALEDLQTRRYPDLHPQTLTDLVPQSLAA